MRRRRSAIAALLAALLATILALPVLAADPPADVVLDGTVTVTFIDPQDDGPIADADITLVARRPDLGEDSIIQTLTGQTDADGTAVLTGVARPDDGAPPVDLTATAYREEPNSCGGVEAAGGTADAAGALEVAIEIVAGFTSSCVSAPVVGTVLDSDGEPFLAAFAEAAIDYPGIGAETEAVEVDENGDFSFLIHGWPGQGPASVEVTVIGEETTVSNPDTGCEERVALNASGSWEIASVQQVGAGVALVAEPVVLEEVCGTQGTPAAPQITLPPTDTIPTTDRRRACPGVAVQVPLRRWRSSSRSSWPGRSRPAPRAVGSSRRGS